MSRIEANNHTSSKGSQRTNFAKVLVESTKKGASDGGNSQGMVYLRESEQDGAVDSRCFGWTRRNEPEQSESFVNPFAVPRVE